MVQYHSVSQAGRQVWEMVQDAELCLFIEIKQSS